MLAQQGLHPPAFLAVIVLDDGQTGAGRVHSGVGIGAAFDQQFRRLRVVSRACPKEAPAARRQFLWPVGIGPQVKQFFDDPGMAVAGGVGERTSPSVIEVAGLGRIGRQHRIDAVFVAGSAGDAESVLRAAGEQVAGDRPRVLRGFGRQIAGPVPVVAVQRDQQRSLAVGAAGFDVGASCGKGIHQVVLPRQRRPMQRPVAQRVRGVDESGILGQHRFDPGAVAALDRLGHRCKPRIVAEAPAHRRRQQRLHLPVAALLGDGQQLVPGVVGIARLPRIRPCLQQQLDHLGMVLAHRHVDGKLVPVLGVDQPGVALEQGADLSHIAGTAGAEELPGPVPVHRLDPALVALRLHAFRLQQTGHPLRETLARRLALRLQFPSGHPRNPLPLSDAPPGQV